MRILILGGTGFIGREVVRALNGHELCLFHRSGAESPSGTVRHIYGDRGNLAASRGDFAAFAPDVVLDMTPQNGRDAEQAVTCLVGLAGRAAAVSSLSVYRAFGRLLGTEPGRSLPAPLSENQPLRSRMFPYRGPAPRGAGDPRLWMDDYDKIPAERAFLGGALPASVVRLPMVYGPGDADRRVGAYLDRLRGGRPLVLGETAAAWRNARNFVRNVAQAIALVTLRGVPGRVYNAPAPHDLSELEWVRHIARAAGLTNEIRAVEDGTEGALRPLIDEFPAHADFRQHLVVDDSRIRVELGCEDAVPLEAALAETVASLQAADP
ncbi:MULTISPECIES: NAD-dependent epimerase/dehydratase family protein [unclassified Phenylobacterium]|uniref:NAD-dependent epimerase/dehydratase family protein n=1 Tax=unclassified Phenylobacterium TaxID=2640670 RepID=UPI0009E98384|nr:MULTISPECIES: NAD-dependent epimerase/dehydratase family protein [unclassified Phenylobacterium]